MWIQIRSADCKVLHRIEGLSKLTKIDDLRLQLVEKFDAQPEQQRLFYRGKQLEDGHTLYDYDVKQNDMIQIMIRPTLPPVAYTETKEEKSCESESHSDKENVEPEEVNTSSSDSAEEIDGATFKIGDILDGRDSENGSWHELTIKRVNKASEEDNAKLPSSKSQEGAFPFRGEADPFVYTVTWDGYEDEGESQIRSNNMRPRARQILSLEEVNDGDQVMINYNMGNTKARGYWYDAVVTGKKSTRTVKELLCTIHFGSDLAPLNDCKCILTDEIFAIEPLGSHKNIHKDGVEATPTKRTNKPECDKCQDNPDKKCKDCACVKCGGKDRPDKTIMCDECNEATHIDCLEPPLDSVPEADEWYCPHCKLDENIVVKAGEKLKHSKKKAKMVSATGNTTRDWGKGMATVGRTKICTIVPTNHFGPIPGVEVGSNWLFRVQVSEAGVHRPHVAGIAGRAEEGAMSIVLSGGYEDDVDFGDKFEYTGSGGRDLSGNKRTAEQSCDQTLTRYNLALAKSCAAPINSKLGAEAKDWKAGKPIRVCRGSALAKHSKYAPTRGVRYDGIYKITKYWPQKGQKGFIVWRYEFRRDDPIPAPWTKAGKKRIGELGLTLEIPEGYEEKLAEREKAKEAKKRKSTADDDLPNGEDDKPPTPKAKKTKIAKYKPSAEVAKCIEADEANRKLWDEVMSYSSEGHKKVMEQIQEVFCCICCQDLVYEPVTTDCSHNMCKTCLQRMFKAQVYCCPNCRHELGANYKLSVNKSLSEALKLLYPGYGTAR